ncbi:MAG: glutamate racemase [Actinobacteria bacterium]|nr:glutamate racemase [Actinomycetota bacterium]
MIGVFDSGVGGLSVLIEIRKALPDADLVYVADRGRAPYGPRSLTEIQRFSAEIADWLIDRGCTTLVVACNTASAAALEELRSAHPGMQIVGMEPAVKPAAVATSSGVIAVFATAATFQGRLFESVVSRFGEGRTVVTTACPEWVELVETGHVEGPMVESAVVKRVVPAIEVGADTLVLGCTHFSFLADVIGRVGGPGTRVIDPAQAVAAQTARVAPITEGQGHLVFAASGDRDRLADLARALAGLTADEVFPFP